jgi:cytochrome c553
VKLAGLGRWLLTGATALFISTAFAQVSPDRIAACGGCHGPDGNSPVPGVPSLAGQPKVFLENYLVMTREGIRGSEVMQSLLKDISDREITAIAGHYTGLRKRPVPGATDAALLARGREVAEKNHCGSCHLPNYHGQQQVPRLASQREDFLYEALIAYRQNKRPGGDTIMAASIYGIPDADLKAMAHYFARSE